MYRRPREHRAAASGIVYIVALLLLAVFSALAVAFATTTDMNVRISDNCRDAQTARLAAESGLEFAMLEMKQMQSEGSWSGVPDMLGLAYDHLAAKLNGTANLAGCSVALATAGDGSSYISVPDIALPNEAAFNFTIAQPETNKLLLTVTGNADGITRTVQIQYTVHEDTSVLSYAVASRPRMIMRGNVQIEGDICSSWTRTSEAPPFDIDLSDEAYITEGIKTTLSQEEFEEEGSQDHIDEDFQDQISYDEPEVTTYTTEDFDTTPIIDWMASNNKKNTLPDSATHEWEKFPNNWTGTWFDRPIYTNQTLNWCYIPKNTHARFKGCTFKGITYIDTDGTTESSGNNIVFEDCTFEGPIVTDVPGSFQWKYNALNFEGDTEFKPSQIAEYLDGCTILAPNFNVNIGDFHKEGTQSDSKITGILVGGIVDIRDNALVEGTILSMANLDHVSNPYKYGTNLGYWEADAEEYGGQVPTTTNIRIIPTPASTLPIGIRKRYTVSPDMDTYVEVN